MRRAASLVALAALAGCASLDGVAAKKPKSGDIARILEVEHACAPAQSDVSAPSSTPTGAPAPAEAKAEACPSGRTAKRVVVRDLSCKTLALRAGVPEVARARCAFAATVVFADGATMELGRSESDFGLHDYAPGAWAPIFQWARTK